MKIIIQRASHPLQNLAACKLDADDFSRSNRILVYLVYQTVLFKELSCETLDEKIRPDGPSRAYGACGMQSDAGS